MRLESASALGDAIIGQGGWDDPEVLQELEILLGPFAEFVQWYIFCAD
jgi:hypothetical protein